MAKTQTVAFLFKCTKCKRLIAPSSKNAAENKEKIKLNRFCKFCRERTEQTETKISKAKK